MRVVETLKSRCLVCMSFNLLVYIDRHFDGIIIKCAACGYDDFISNPFGDLRIFLDRPKNWHLVYNGGKTIRH